MAKCLIVTCKKCQGIVAICKILSPIFVATGVEWEGNPLKDLTYGYSDVAAINKMPVCDCKPAAERGGKL